MKGYGGEMNYMRTILSLFDYSGNWSRPYREAGYTVQQVDLQGPGFFPSVIKDVRLLDAHPLQMDRVWGILAAPPCTHFAKSGARWWAEKGDAALLEGLSTIDAVMRLVWVCRPKWWVLENPGGRLTTYLGQPQFGFDPCDFGDPYTKRTYLWGDFAPPTAILAPVGACEPTLGSKMHKISGRNKNARSETPMGFARAFFEANP